MSEYAVRRLTDRLEMPDVGDLLRFIVFLGTFFGALFRGDALRLLRTPDPFCKCLAPALIPFFNP